MNNPLVYSSIKWTRDGNTRQTAGANHVNLAIRFFPTHENPYVLHVSHAFIPVWKFAPHFTFSTEQEARDFGLAVVNHFVLNPQDVAALK